MKCPLCRHGELLPGLSDETLLYEGMTLVVQGVPAEICDTCGEPYFDEQVTQRLLEMARQAVMAGVIVDVRRYIAA